MNAIKEELKLANETMGDAEQMRKEKRLKSAVNRAYYAMFHATKAILLSQGTDCQSHAGAINRFGEYVVRKGFMGERFARSLRYVHKLREKCDYSPAFKIEEKDVDEIIIEAKEFLETVKQVIKCQ